MPLPTHEELKARLEAAFPGLKLEFLANPLVASQPSLVVPPAEALRVAQFLRDDPQLRFDFCSNVTGVDWPEREDKVKVKKLVEGVEKEVEEVRRQPGYQEVVYHLYSMDLRHGPVILRQRTGNRTDDCAVASLTPVWRGCEFQEREAYDLFGMRFAGHPDLRRILMWEGYPYFPLRKDFPLGGKPTELPDIAFTRTAPLEGGPFVTVPTSDGAVVREPRSRNPES